MICTEMTNLPIQVLAVCGADGGFEPLRFRFEDAEHQMHTVRIVEIVDVREIEYVGIEAFRFLCRAEEDGIGHLFELSYTVRSHRWALFRAIY